MGGSRLLARAARASTLEGRVKLPTVTTCTRCSSCLRSARSGLPGRVTSHRASPVRPDRGARFRRRNEDELPSRLDPRECNGSSCRALWRYPRRDAQSDEPGRSELPEEGNSKARPAPPSFASQLLSDLAHRVLGDATRSLAAINDARAVRVGRRAPLRSARLPETVGAPALGLGSCRARERCSAPAPRLQQRADGSGSVPRRARCSSKGATLPGSENTSPARERSRLVHGRQSHQRSVR
jgi:hypothetical protein